MYNFDDIYTQSLLELKKSKEGKKIYLQRKKLLDSFKNSKNLIHKNNANLLCDIEKVYIQELTKCIADNIAKSYADMYNFISKVEKDNLERDLKNKR